jgi:hypothetical protein
MAKLKSELHHWWPRSLSSRWAAEDNKTGWIKPDGTCKRLPPHHLGVILDGHHIRFGDRGESTLWDTSFEDEFDKADSHFPAVVAWLERLDRRPTSSTRIRDRFVSQPARDEELRQLTECVVSLAVRSPMNREASVAAAEHIRGPLKNPERERLIAANMRNSQRVVADSIGASAKFAVLFSGAKEFIFGDGFFHNVTAAVNRPLAPTIVAPITPEITVIVARPIEYMVEPRLSTIVLYDAEVDVCNSAVQVYARNALYFRNDRPPVGEAFARAEHLRYAHPDNPMDELVRSIPGIPPRDSSLDFLFNVQRRK